MHACCWQYNIHEFLQQFGWLSPLCLGLLSSVPFDDTVQSKGNQQSPQHAVGRRLWSELEVLHCCLSHTTPFLDSAGPLGEDKGFY